MGEYERNLSDQELATMWLGYGFDHEQISEEMGRRWPRLAGWKAAADHLSREHWNRWHEQRMAQGIHSLAELGPDDQDPGAVELMARYRESVQRIAAGERESSADENSGLFL